MALQTFTAPSFSSPGVHLPNFPGVIERLVALDLDLLIGPDGTDATPLEAGDVIKVFKLPAGAKLLYGRIEAEDLDSGTPAITLDLYASDGTTTKYFFDESTIAQAGGIADTRESGVAGAKNALSADTAIGFVVPFEESDWYVALRCGTVAATFQNDGVAVAVGYTMAVENTDYDRDFPTPNPT